MQHKTNHYHGSLLVEAAIAGAIFAIGLALVYITFVQAISINTHNQQNALALSILNGQIDTDLKSDYNLLSDTNPPLSSVTALPQATLTRTVLTDTNTKLKTMTYTLSWRDKTLLRTLTANSELTESGLNND